QHRTWCERPRGLGGLHRGGGDKGLGFSPCPATGRYGVSVQTAQSATPFVAVDPHELPLARRLHHHDGDLLADFSERSQEPPLRFRSHHLQPLITKRELMKF